MISLMGAFDKLKQTVSPECKLVFLTTWKNSRKEEVLFHASATLFELDVVEKKWIERGLGFFHVERLKTDPTNLRLVMRTLSTFNLILDSPIYPDMTVTPLDKQPACINFTAIPIPVSSSSSSSFDSATGAVAAEAAKGEKKQPSKFRLCFDDAETAAKALQELQDAIKFLSSKKYTAPTAADSSAEAKMEVDLNASPAAPAAVDASPASQTS